MNVNGEDSLNEGERADSIPIDGQLPEKDIPHDETEPEVKVVPTELPVYCMDEPPEGKDNYIKWALLHGFSEDDLVPPNGDQNPTTVRIMALQLEDEGLRQRPKKLPKEKAAVAKDSAGKAVAKKASAIPKVFAHGSPPEAILETMAMPGVDGLEQFIMGSKYGASMVILGVRIAQELSEVGIKQAKPLIDIARDMRSGEAAAAESAASSAAQAAADSTGNRIMNEVSPYLAKLDAMLAKGEVEKAPLSKDPFKAEMAKMMMPMVKNLMGKMMPGLIPEGEADLPADWSKE